MCQKSHDSKILVICCITAEGNSIDIKLMKMKSLNVTHAKQIFFKRTNSETKLGTFHVNNMKNFEARHEVLENVDVMETFVVRD